MRHQASKELFAYWNKLRGARAAPDRAHIDPGAIRHILADSFIVEVDADGVFPFRFSGARINALWRAEQKGESFVALWRDAHRHSLRAALATVSDGAIPIIAGARARSTDGAQLDLELLLLPLRHFGRTHARMLGALSTAYPADRLGAFYVSPLEFLSMRVLSLASRPGAHSGEEGTRPRPRLVVYNRHRQ